MDVRNDSSLYSVGKMVAETETYRLYLSKYEETGRQCLLQIATSVEHNGKLDRAVFIIKELSSRADSVEKEYAKVKTDPNQMLNYGLSLPEVIDSFVCEEQGKRRINILAFKNVENVSSMVPLINITTKDRLRVDLRTSVWIMGKLLKLLAFTQSEGISIGLVSGNNILIEPDQHYVLVFDWSEAQMHSGIISREIRSKEIVQAAQATIRVLGGDPETEFIPNDGDEKFAPYIDYLLQLARATESNTERAHASFYELVDTIWKREFYQFTTKPLTV